MWRRWLAAPDEGRLIGSFQKRSARKGVGEGVGDEESRTSARVCPIQAAYATKMTAPEANHIPAAYFMKMGAFCEWTI